MAEGPFFLDSLSSVLSLEGRIGLTITSEILIMRKTMFWIDNSDENGLYDFCLERNNYCRESQSWMTLRSRIMKHKLTGDGIELKHLKGLYNKMSEIGWLDQETLWEIMSLLYYLFLW